MGPIVGEKFFWGNCLSETVCSSVLVKLQKKGGVTPFHSLLNFFASYYIGYLGSSVLRLLLICLG